MADRRAGVMVSTSGKIFWMESLMSNTAIFTVYESANAGSDCRDFSVGRSIDVIAVVTVQNTDSVHAVPSRLN